jgi:hypothetical protein
MVGREWNSMLYNSMNSSAFVPKYSLTYIYTTHFQNKVGKISRPITQYIKMGSLLGVFP